jgi:hypothetical protein
MNNAVEQNKLNGLITEVNSLLRDYYLLISGFNKEPKFSAKNFAFCYWRCVVWISSIYIVPITGFLNLVILIFGLRKNRTERYYRYSFVTYIKQIFKDISNGNITILSWFTLRFLTQTCTVLRIKSNVEKIRAIFLNYNVETSIGNGDFTTSGVVNEIKAYSEFLSTYLETIKWKTRFNILILATPYILSVSHLVSKLSTSNSPGSNLFSFMHDSRGNPNLLYFVSDVVGALCFIATALLIPSSFVRKRELFTEYNLYQKEYLTFYKLDSTPVTEFPFDIILWVLIFALFFPIIIPEYKTDIYEMVFVLANACFIGLIFIRASIGRILFFRKLKNSLNPMKLPRGIFEMEQLPPV